jgi:hypothetical protein
MCAELARVSWTVDRQPFETSEAILEDISALGGCVQLEVPVPVGTAIMLIFHSERFHGRVRYCVAGEFGYFIGIKFAPDSPWSQDLASPAHLTNLETVKNLLPPA